MFDHLDDDFPPVPDGLARVHVERRAAGRKRRRVALASATGAAVVAGLLGAAVVATATTGGSGDSSISYAGQPQGTVEGTTEPPPSEGPDDRPGWTDGVTTCRNITDIPSGPPSEVLVRDLLSAQLVLPASAPAGQDLPVTIRLSNSGDVALRVTLSDASSDSAIVKNGAHLFSVANAVTPLRSDVVVPAGGTADVARTAKTVRCGDTKADPTTPLPAGRVGVGVDFGVESVTTPSGQQELYDRDQVQLMDFLDLT